jgi:hypothetical protein
MSYAVCSKSHQNLGLGSDAPDRVERWIATGGPVMFQGMPAEVTTRSLLKEFIGKLEAMPWSVSRVRPLIAEVATRGHSLT